MANLKAEFFGIEAPNPFCLAASPLTDSAAKLRRAFQLGWGGAVLKTVVLAGGAGPGYGFTARSNGAPMGWADPRDWDLDTALAQVVELRETYPNRPLGFSLAGDERASAHGRWQRAVTGAVGAGASWIEMAFDPAQPSNARSRAGFLSLLAACRETAEIPFVVKLTGLVEDSASLAAELAQAGASGVCLAGQIVGGAGLGMGGVTLANPPGHRPQVWAMGGDAVWPNTLSMLGHFRAPAGEGFALSIAGGITDWKRAAEGVSLGSTQVQIATAAMVQGVGIIAELTSGLSQWMDERGFRQLPDLIGSAVALDGPVPGQRAQIDARSCIGCGACARSCAEAATGAILVSRSRAYSVDDGLCIGCGLCAVVCPVEDCVSLMDLAPVVTSGVAPEGENEMVPDAATQTSMD